jgi:DNA polymerase-3 subunit epsilon
MKHPTSTILQVVLVETDAELSNEESVKEESARAETQRDDQFVHAKSENYVEHGHRADLAAHAEELLYRVTFVVIDVETTGWEPGPDALTEVAAVRFTGGEQCGTYHSLVDPGVHIPDIVSELTGIDDELVHGAPDISVVLPELVETIGDGVLVGHNVGFDLSFIDAALTENSFDGICNPVVDTLHLARRLVRDDVIDCKLATLARRLRLDHSPSHRALEDVLATADLLHALIERATGYGVLRLCDLLSF